MGSAGSICGSTWPAFPRQKDGSNIRVWKHITAFSSCHPGGGEPSPPVSNERKPPRPLPQSPEILGNSSKMNFSTLDRTHGKKIAKSWNRPWKCYAWTWPSRTHLRACLFLVLTNPLWIAAFIPPSALYFGKSCSPAQWWEKLGPPVLDLTPVCKISGCPSCNGKGSAQALTKLSSSFPGKTRPVARRVQLVFLHFLEAHLHLLTQITRKNKIQRSGLFPLQPHFGFISFALI